MVRGPKLSPEAFDRLLNWLAPSREAAAAQYREIHKKLTRLFSYKGVACPEELADVVMDRVAMKVLQEPVAPFCDDHLKWFYAFSKFVYLEHYDDVRKQTESHAVVRSEGAECETLENQRRCLDLCLAQLDRGSRDLLLRYYDYADGEKVRHRKLIAQQLHIRANALRIRISRIRSTFGDCVRRCVQREG